MPLYSGAALLMGLNKLRLSKGVRWGLWVTIPVLVLGWFATMVFWPFSEDQGVFAWVGDVIVSGGIPCKDAWEQKGPLTHYVYALAQWLFGRTQWGIRLFDLGLILAGAFSLAGIAKRLGFAKWALPSSLLFLLWYGSTGYCNTAQPDGWAAILAIFMIDLLLRDSGALGNKAALIGGVLLGLSILLKIPYVLFVIILMSYAMVYRSAGIKKTILFSSLILAGFGGILIVTVAWFVWNDAWRDLVQIQLVFNRKVAWLTPQRNIGWTILELVKYFFASGKTPAFALSVVGLATLWGRQKKQTLLLIAWGITATFCVAVQNKFYGYHWHLVLPPLSLLTMIGFAEIWRKITDLEFQFMRPFSSKNFVRLSLVMVIGIIFLQAAMRPLNHTLQFGLRVTGLKSWPSYYERFCREHACYYYAAIQDVSEYLRENTTEQDRVLVWGFEPIINYLSGRKAPNRFGNIHALVIPNDNDNLQTRYRHEFLTSIKTSPPKYIVILEKDTDNPLKDVIKGYLASFPEFILLINARYERVKQIRDFVVFQLKNLKKDQKI